jgi:hypothetical protein
LRQFQPSGAESAVGPVEQQMRGDKSNGDRLGKLVERSKLERIQRPAPVAPGRFGRGVSRPRITNHALSDQERLWIDILTRGR